MPSPKSERDFFRIIPFGIIWLTYAIVHLLLEKGLLYELDFYPSTGNPYYFGVNSLSILLIAVISGLLMGAFEIRFLSTLFTNHSFGKKIIYKILIYIFLMVTFLVAVSMFDNSSKLHTNILDQRVWENIWSFFSSISFWSFQLYLAAMIGLTLFYSEVSDNLGMSVLNNIFAGKYHKPVQEERIFMFLDMKSSTTIAEKIGHIRYFEMLKEYYSDLSDSIIQSYGEVYQYVGDEIVVSWKLKNGIRENNFLKCFFAMKESLRNHSEKYQSKFGVRPSFKAGFHCGRVTTGEIGVLKKEIVFSGDVLNTTARIQGLCNNYNAEVLISERLKNKMNIESEFQAQSHGINELKGRKETIELFSVQLKGKIV